MKNVAYVDQPCLRCGSPKRISRTWKEKIPTLMGTTEVEYSQLVCTNPECQKAFDENLAVEKQKQEKIKLKREENDVKRKQSSLDARKNKKSTSRI